MKKLRILLLEDNDDDADLFERMVEKDFPDPFEITRAKSFAEGKAAFANADIIVCDLGLPDSKGPETVLNIYAQVPHIPLLVLSGNQDPMAFKQVVSSGAHDCLIKGVISSEALCRCILSATIRKQIELRLVQGSENKSAYVAQVSHEIRTPLNVLLGFLEILQKENKNKDLEQYLELMGRTGGTIKDLLDDILDLSKIEAGKLELEETPFNLHLLLKTAFEIFQTKALGKGLELKQVLGPDIPEFVKGDGRKIRQVIFNLLGNAIKFTHRGFVALSVTRAPDGKRILFAVEDSGKGIDLKLQDKLFTPFEQGGLNTTKEFGGTGLGLAICKKLVTLMGGEIAAQNRAEIGAVFSFSLPLETAAQPTVEQSAREKSDQAKDFDFTSLKGKKILIADDSPESLMLYGAYLRVAEPRLDTAENGRLAFELFKKSQHEIVILDNQMPEMTGIDAAAAIRAHEASLKAKPALIILLTGDTEASVKARADECKVSQFLVKPIGRKRFLEAVLGSS